MTSTHTLSTASKAPLALIRVCSDGSVHLVGYAHSAESADKRVRTERNKGHVTRAFPIVDRKIVVEIGTSETGRRFFA